VALQGTISDFSLADILQLIGIQRKTGILTLDNGAEGVTVKFLDGQVVGADTRSHSVEDLLGSVLVRTGRLTEAQLQEALRMQKRTLQRLGHVLVNAELISEDDLVEALRVQSLQIVYRLFRWRKGGYDFTPTDDLEYDEKHFTPIHAETILMEGARMIDEWPIIERKIKSDRMILRLTDAGQRLQLTVRSIDETDVDLQFRFDDEGQEPTRVDGSKEEIRLSAEEREVLGLVDGKRCAEEINDRSSLGEFDTYRILADLLTRNLVEEVKRPTVHDAVPRSTTRSAPLFHGILALCLGLAVLSSLATLHYNALSPWKVLSRDPATAQLQFHASQSRLARIERAIQVYYLDSGTFPQRLELLAERAFLHRRDLLDPWGRAYGYLLGAGGYQLFGLDADRQPREELSRSRQFSAAERMMTPPPAMAEEETEGPQVIPAE
jgi:hypothetical protein